MNQIHTLDDQTIIALCTPNGSGAIALLRLSGLDAKDIADKFCKPADGTSILEKTSHTIHYGSIKDLNGNIIDKAMFMIMDSPRTFTGQNTVEITCHNNQFLIQEIINLAILCGARLAQEGEFSKRAFLNGKMDLLQVEAINELIGANTQLALKKSLSQLDGSFSNWVNQIETGLIRTLAFCETSFEFLDEEQEFGNKIKEDLKSIIEKIEKIRSIFDQQQQIKQGIKIALIGSVNAGKSSIFNSILGHKRAIVTNIAGTTRDSIEAGVTKNGNFWTIIDTAGLRQTDDLIEQEGIKRSLEEAHKADIILLVFDGSKEFSQEIIEVYKDIIKKYPKKIILVQNKIDLENSDNLNNINRINKFSISNFSNIDTNSDLIKVSSLKDLGIKNLEEAIQFKVEKLLSNIDSPFLLNKRQASLLLSLEDKLHKIESELNGQIQYELLSYNLKDAIASLSELTGKSISEAGMNAVFKEFCVGK